MLVKLIVAVISLVVVVSSSLTEWEKFKNDYNKQYESAAEETKRQHIFLENLSRIRAHRQKFPDATFTIGINHLADRTTEELVSRTRINMKSRPKGRQGPPTSQSFPDSLDWRSKNVTTPVRDQGAMGQVSAIVAVEVVETLYAIQTKQLIAGSIARVADCCPQPIDELECVAKQGGICRASDYPKTTGQCLPNKCQPFARVNKVMKLKTPNEDTMVAWIQNSTLSVGIDASQSSFQFYTSGLYSDPGCSTTIDHMMQLVGYGKTSSGELYWICKNSWGMGWGENGYMRVLRGKNMCGIASYVSQAA